MQMRIKKGGSGVTLAGGEVTSWTSPFGHPPENRGAEQIISRMYGAHLIEEKEKHFPLMHCTLE